MGLFDSGGSGDWISTAFQVGGSLLGQHMATEANNDAAQAVQQANADAAAREQQASREAQQAVAAGNAAAQARLARLEESGRPGVSYLRSVVAGDPAMLSPQQNVELQEAQRIGANQLATTGLRGSGRAVTGMLRKLNEGGRVRMIEDNRQRQGNAATALSNLSTGATTQMAGIDQGSGGSAGNIILGSGRTEAGLITDSGSARGNALAANGAVSNSTLGALSGIFAADERNKQRERRYGEMTGA